MKTRGLTVCTLVFVLPLLHGLLSAAPADSLDIERAEKAVENA